jgi:hypothetical protein
VPVPTFKAGIRPFVIFRPEIVTRTITKVSDVTLTCPNHDSPVIEVEPRTPAASLVYPSFKEEGRHDQVHYKVRRRRVRCHRH